MSNKYPILFNKDVPPNSGCEFVVSINKNGQLILIEREIRLGFQSPRPNPENRGEFQSPRIIDRVSEFNIDSSFINQMKANQMKANEMKANEMKANAKTVNARSVNARSVNARSVNARSVNARSVNARTVNDRSINTRTVNKTEKFNPITINTNMKNIYYKAILIDVYDDNAI
jgi:hypothetical protein